MQVLSDGRGRRTVTDRLITLLPLATERADYEALGWLTPAEKRAKNLGIELNQAA